MSDSILDRRDFLKGAAIIGATTGAGLLGATSAVAASGSGSATSSASASKSATSASSSSAISATDYSIDPVAGLHSWEIIPDPIADSDIMSTSDYDIVIVGAGIAGVTTTYAAAAAGAKVACIETLPTYSARGLDNGGVDSKVQQAAGITIDHAECVNNLMKASNFKANINLIKKWVDNSGKAIDWVADMATANGLETTVIEGGVDEPWYQEYRTAHNFGEGSFIDDKMTWAEYRTVGWIEQAAKDAGGEFIYNTHAEQLVRDGDTVTAVIARNADGYVKYTASKGIVIATGDYCANAEMVDQWAPFIKRADVNTYTPAGANKGEGLCLAMWVGGTMQKYAHAPMLHPIFAGGALATYPWLWVNSLGRRYTNEDIMIPIICNTRMMQPGNIAWAIYDSKYADILPGFPTAYMRVKSVPDGIEDTIASAIESGNGYQADSLDDLASQMGVSADEFNATVSRYNELYTAGKDEDFDKDASCLYEIANPPFYAMKVPAALLVMVGGLNVDDNLQVLDEDDTPIPGLYAVGNAQGNMFGNDYPMVCPGISHGRCLTFGLILGQALATDQEFRNVSL